MPLSQRPSANTGARAHQTGHGSPPAQDLEEKLRDALNLANTELNKSNADRDRFQAKHEATQKKLNDAARATVDLKTQLQAIRDDNLALKGTIHQLRDDYDDLEYERATLSQCYSELKAAYDKLAHEYGVSSVQSPTLSITGPMPERPKDRGSSGASKEHRDSREHRDRGRERDHDRGREKEREREKKDREKREKKDHKADKERLSKRFEDRRPPTSGRRGSFIEGRPPGGGRASSAAPVGRAYTNVATGQVQVPAVSQSHRVSYSNVPRTVNPMSPAAYDGARYDEAGYEDGNYHPYPIAR